jgi:hypothetical protein
VTPGLTTSATVPFAGLCAADRSRASATRGRDARLKSTGETQPRARCVRLRSHMLLSACVWARDPDLRRFRLRLSRPRRLVCLPGNQPRSRRGDRDVEIETWRSRRQVELRPFGRGFRVTAFRRGALRLCFGERPNSPAGSPKAIHG